MEGLPVAFVVNASTAFSSLNHRLPVVRRGYLRESPEIRRRFMAILS